MQDQPRKTSQPKSTKKVRARRVDPPKGKGPLAPKPSGVFADTTVRAPSVTDKPAPKPRQHRPAKQTPSALDVLPKAKGQPAQPYKPKAATKVVKAQRSARRQRQAEARDTKSNDDRARAQAYLDANPEILHQPKKDGGSLIASIHLPSLKTVERVAAVANPIGGVNLLTKGGVRKTLGNIPKDTAELVTTTPTSLVRLGDMALHHPDQLPKTLAQPYIDLVKHPGKTIQEHPVSTALMVAPAGKIPGRAAGRVARVGGKQTLERAPATLPGTALKEARTKSRGVVTNAVQTRRDRARPAPTVTDKQLDRRVDEFFDFSRQKRGQIEASVAAKTKQANKSLPRAQRRVVVKQAVNAAGKGSKKTVDQRFVKEFGSTWRADPTTGVVVKPKAATEGHLHATRAEADAVANAIRNSPNVDWEPQVMPAGQKFGVVPKTAKTRLNKQRAVGTSPATMAKTMRRSRQALTNAVLPLSTKWLMGQVSESGVRAAVAGAGPADLLRVNRIVKTMNKAEKGSGDEFLMRISGGQFGLTGTAREFAQGSKSLADEFAGTSLAKPASAASKVGGALPAKAVRQGWNQYTRVVLDAINGTVENTARKAMAGQAVRQGGLMERRVIGLSDRAIQDAAKGLRGTDAQVQLARAVDDMYGKYQKFSPDKRSLLLHWTPFLPWYLNTAKFLFKVLPADHPVKTALIANTSLATEEWRKEHGLSLYSEDQKPAWMQGTYPSSGGPLGKGLIPVGKYSPFGVGTDVPGAVADLTLPQFLGPIKNAGGVDWKWQSLKDHGKPFTASQKALRALVTAVESQVPGVSQGLRIPGIERTKIDRKDPDEKPRQAIGRLVNPLAPINGTEDDIPEAESSSGAGPLPGGLSQREIDALVAEAQRQASRVPQVSQKEIDAILRSMGR